MKVSEVIQRLNLKLISGEKGVDSEILGGYSSDLLSDVMGRSQEGQVWITVQTHMNVVAIASLKELAAVIIVSGQQPEEAAIEKSELEGIPLLSTSMSAFEISGQLYSLLN